MVALFFTTGNICKFKFQIKVVVFGARITSCNKTGLGFVKNKNLNN